MTTPLSIPDLNAAIPAGGSKTNGETKQKAPPSPPSSPVTSGESEGGYTTPNRDAPPPPPFREAKKRDSPDDEGKEDEGDEAKKQRVVVESERDVEFARRVMDGIYRSPWKKTLEGHEESLPEGETSFLTKRQETLLETFVDCLDGTGTIGAERLCVLASDIEGMHEERSLGLFVQGPAIKKGERITVYGGKSLCEAAITTSANNPWLAEQRLAKMYIDGRAIADAFRGDARSPKELEERLNLCHRVFNPSAEEKTATPLPMVTISHPMDPHIHVKVSILAAPLGALANSSEGTGKPANCRLQWFPLPKLGGYIGFLIASKDIEEGEEILHKYHYE